MNDAGRASRAGVGLALAVAGVALLMPASARADLISDADRLAQAWRDGGAEVTRLPPRFLERGQLWHMPARHGDDAEGCTSLVVLATRNTELDVRTRSSLRGVGVPSEEPTARSSEAGLAVVTRCGSRRDAWAHTVVEMRSRRGAVEAMIVRSRGATRSPYQILPSREPVDRTPMGRPGRPAAPEPVADRLERAERGARSEGATQVVRIPMRSSPAGTGRFEVQLGQGCHRVQLMATVPRIGLRLPVDVDAELRVAGTDRLLGRDRGDAIDAGVDFCLGEKTGVEVSYVGAGGETDVTLMSSTWPIPEWVPSLWGPIARAGFATAFRRRHTPTPTTGPILRALGAQGWTRIPITVEAGHCYLASVAVTRGRNDGLRLRAAVEARTSIETLPGAVPGLALTFCSTFSDRAVVEVETRGQGPRWALAVWPVGAP